jgi:hypothetical protein
MKLFAIKFYITVVKYLYLYIFALNLIDLNKD